MTARWNGSVDVDAVTELVEHVAATVVAPRFRDLHAAEVREKAPGDVVTVVDVEAEAALIEGLARIAPGIPVVGEEGTSADPDRLRLLAEADRVFVVDPLDGTQAFVDGSPDHAVMVGLVEHGEAVAGWIRLAEHGRTLVAERGSGAWLNGTRLAPPAPVDPADANGGVAVWAMDPEVTARLTAPGSGLPDDVSRGRLWSGYEYSRLVTGERQFLVYWRTWPWDHVPGAALLGEVGGVSRRLDGSGYRADVTQGTLVAAADEATYEHVSRVLRAAGA